MDVGYRFNAPHTQETIDAFAAYNKYASCPMDFVIKTDSVLAKDAVTIAGFYAHHDSKWIAFNSDGEHDSMRLLQDILGDEYSFTYKDIVKYVGEFRCAARVNTPDAVGTTITVELRLFPEDEESILLDTFSYTFTHNYVPTVTKPTCTAQGYTTYACSRCGDYYRENYTQALGHNYVRIDSAPDDKTAGFVAYRCLRCEAYFAAAYENGAYVPAAPVESLEEAAQTTPLPAPTFNIFKTEEIDYSAHKASLKIDETDVTDTDFDFDSTQGLRFTASMKLPDGVSYAVGSEGNTVTDFGFVYSQTQRIGNNVDNLVFGTKDVYSMSVKESNAGTFDGSNWNGVSYHAQDNTLTFNLVIDVAAANWSKDYCARAFVTYRFNGYTFTVYDVDFASKSVKYIAEQTVQSDSETQLVKEFCQNKILNNI